MTEVQTGYLLIVNAVTFLAFGIDKKRAKKEQWRVPERTLLLFALAGGSVGALAGMYTFRHKTRKIKFSVGIPVIFILQIFIYKFVVLA